MGFKNGFLAITNIASVVVVEFAVVVAMAEKTGKMFTMPQKKGVKSSLKSASGKEGLNFFQPFVYCMFFSCL